MGDEKNIEYYLVFPPDTPRAGQIWGYKRRQCAEEEKHYGWVASLGPYDEQAAEPVQVDGMRMLRVPARAAPGGPDVK